MIIRWLINLALEVLFSIATILIAYILILLYQNVNLRITFKNYWRILRILRKTNHNLNKDYKKKNMCKEEYLFTQNILTFAHYKIAKTFLRNYYSDETYLDDLNYIILIAKALRAYFISPYVAKKSNKIITCNIKLHLGIRLYLYHVPFFLKVLYNEKVLDKYINICKKYGQLISECNRNIKTADSFIQMLCEEYERMCDKSVYFKVETNEAYDFYSQTLNMLELQSDMKVPNFSDEGINEVSELFTEYALAIKLAGLYRYESMNYFTIFNEKDLLDDLSNTLCEYISFNSITYIRELVIPYVREAKKESLEINPVVLFILRTDNAYYSIKGGKNKLIVTKLSGRRGRITQKEYSSVKMLLDKNKEICNNPVAVKTLNQVDAYKLFTD